MFKLSKNQRNLFTLDLNSNNNNEKLIKSIASVLNNTTNNNNSQLEFNAHSVLSLEDYMNTTRKRKYEHLFSLVLSLTTQLEYLISIQHVTFYEYRIKNILVVQKDETKVIFINVSNDLLDIKEEKYIRFTKPFNREQCFISPEIQNMKHLPTEINYKTIYYSLGSLAIFFLSKETFLKEEEAVELLKPIAFTKLYWLLLRTLEVLPERRSIIYV